MPIVHLKTQAKFSAAHRLHARDLSDADNQWIFGKCNGLHGHNYTAEVDAVTGMVMDITHLRQFLTQVIDTLDHQHIDNIEWFKTRTSTAENIVVYIWNQLFALIPSNVKMEEIVLTETDKNQVVYRGQ